MSKKKGLSDLEVVKLFRESVFKSGIQFNLAMIIIFIVFGLIFASLMLCDLFIWKDLFSPNSWKADILVWAGLGGLIGVSIFGLVIGVQGYKRGKKLLALKRKQMLPL